MNREQLTLTREEMKDFGYKVVDLIVDHFDTLPEQNPVSRATRPERAPSGTDPPAPGCRRCTWSCPTAPSAP